MAIQGKKIMFRKFNRMVSPFNAKAYARKKETHAIGFLRNGTIYSATGMELFIYDKKIRKAYMIQMGVEKAKDLESDWHERLRKTRNKAQVAALAKELGCGLTATKRLEMEEEVRTFLALRLQLEENEALLNKDKEPKEDQTVNEKEWEDIEETLKQELVMLTDIELIAHALEKYGEDIEADEQAPMIDAIIEIHKEKLGL